MSEKVKTFFHIFKNSLIPECSYYHKLLKIPFSFSLKYLVSLIVTLNLLFTLFLFIKVNPIKIGSLAKNLVANLEKYPNDLVISVHRGQLSTNYDRPYFLWLDSADSKHLILVIDEYATADKINEYNSSTLITRNEIIFKNDNVPAKEKIVSFKSLSDQTITKDTVKNVQNLVLKIMRLLVLFYPLLFIAVLLFLLFSSLLTTFLYLLVAAGINIILFNLLMQKKPALHFGRVFQISIHSATLPLSINYIIGTLNMTTLPLALMFLFLITLFTYAGLTEAHSYEPAHHTHHKK